MNKKDLILSNSQAIQDIFVYYMLDKNSGYFLDIGSAHPININNTFFLEKKGWKGICIDIDDHTLLYENLRTSKFINKDLINNNINDILSDNNVPELIDYISFDVDSATLTVMNIFDFNKYRFKIMTFEHDLYAGGHDKRKQSREILLKQGYKLLCSDIGNGGNIDNLINPYEDWWIDEKFFEKSVYEILQCDSKDWKYVLSKIENSL